MAHAPPVAESAGASLVASAAPKRPLYKRWWLWTTVGVIAAGAIATGLALGLTAPHDAAAPADATHIHF